MNIFEIELREGTVEFVEIEREDGSKLTMKKSTYDEMIAHNEANPL